jgi:hypothetical protein
MAVIPGSPEPSAIDEAWELTRGAVATEAVLQPAATAPAPSTEMAPEDGIQEEVIGRARPSLQPGPEPDAVAVPPVEPRAGTGGPPPAPVPPDEDLPDGARITDVRLYLLDDATALGKPQCHTYGKKVGIVFVHGIGSQPTAETLFDWARPIVRTVWAWSERQAIIDETGFRDPVDVAQVDLTGRSTPFIQLIVPAVAPRGGRPPVPPQTWIMTEAWWAADIRPANITEMVTWSIRHVPAIISGIIGGIRMSKQRRPADPNAPDEPRPLKGSVVAFADAILVGALFGAAAAVAAPVYLALRVIQTLPIPGAKEKLNTGPLDWFLGEWFGDVRVLLHDRSQAANLRMRLATTIDKVRNFGAEHIILVAHSGGTVLSYMMLADPSHDHLEVDKLITHGQAIGLAWKVGGQDSLDTPGYDEGLRTGDRLLRSVHRERPGRRWPRWVDFHATHDVAPAFSAAGWPDPRDPPPGKKPRHECDGPDESWTVSNRMSVIRDHGGYWDNEESFVIPLLRELDTPTGTWEDSRFYPQRVPGYRSRVEDRNHRVRDLARWWILWMALLGIAIVAGLRFNSTPGFGLSPLGMAVGGWLKPLPVLDTLADMPSTLLGLGFVAALAYMVVAGQALGAWNTLDERERTRARTVGSKPVERATARGRIALATLASLAVIGVAVAPGAGYSFETIRVAGIEFTPILNWFVVVITILGIARLGLVARFIGWLVSPLPWLADTSELEPDAEAEEPLARSSDIEAVGAWAAWDVDALPDRARGSPAAEPAQTAIDEGPAQPA